MNKRVCLPTSRMKVVEDNFSDNPSPSPYYAACEYGTAKAVTSGVKRYALYPFLFHTRSFSYMPFGSGIRHIYIPLGAKVYIEYGEWKVILDASRGIPQPPIEEVLLESRKLPRLPTPEEHNIIARKMSYRVPHDAVEYFDGREYVRVDVAHPFLPTRGDIYQVRWGSLDGQVHTIYTVSSWLTKDGKMLDNSESELHQDYRVYKTVEKGCLFFCDDILNDNGKEVVGGDGTKRERYYSYEGMLRKELEVKR